MAPWLSFVFKRSASGLPLVDLEALTLNPNPKEPAPLRVTMPVRVKVQAQTLEHYEIYETTPKAHGLTAGIANVGGNIRHVGCGPSSANHRDAKR